MKRQGQPGSVFQILLESQMNPAKPSAPRRAFLPQGQALQRQPPRLQALQLHKDPKLAQALAQAHRPVPQQVQVRALVRALVQVQVQVRALVRMRVRVRVRAGVMI